MAASPLLESIAEARKYIQDVAGGIRLICEDAEQYSLAERMDFCRQAEEAIAAMLTVLDRLEREA